MSTAVLSPGDHDVDTLIVPSVQDEWGRLKHAAVYDSETSNISEERSLTDEQYRIRDEHKELVRRLMEHGVHTVPMAREESNAYALSIFCRDQLVTKGQTIFVPDLECRRNVINSLRGVVDLRCVTDMEGTAFPEGGDVEFLDSSTAMIGVERQKKQGTHKRRAFTYQSTNGISSLATHLLPLPHAGIHLDCSLSSLPPDVRGPALLYSREKIDSKVMQSNFPSHEQIHIPTQEDGIDTIAPNILWITPGHGIASDAYPRTNQLLRDLGYNIEEVDISSIAKMSGGVRCLVAPIVRS